MSRCMISNAARIAAVLLPLALIACSDDDNGGGTGGYGGSGGSSSGGSGGSGGGPSDAAIGGDSSGGSGPVSDGGRPLPEGSVAPNGTMLAPGILSLVGITVDNYAVYVDEVNATLNVVPLTGGTPSTIGSANNRVMIVGSAVLTWTGTATVAPLSVWTAANGVKPLSTASYSNSGSVAVSPDGTQILFFDDVDDDHNLGNLSIARTDGSAKTLLATSVALRSSTCLPMLSFGGNTAAAAAFCWATSPDGGTNEAGAPVDAQTEVGSPEAGPSGANRSNAVVQTYSGEGWQTTTLATGVAPLLSVAPTGASVLVTGPQGLVVYPMLGGAGTIIDAEAGYGRFTRDGLNVVYATISGALKRSPIDSPATLVLVPYGFTGVRDVSPDEKWALVYSTIDTREDLSDLYLTSIFEPGAVTTLSQAQTAGLFRSDGFTQDSMFAIYYTDIADGLGTLHYAPVAGGAPTAWANNVWIHYAASFNTVVFNDNYDDVTGTGDIRVANAGQSFSSIIVSLADLDFYIAGTRDKVVYTWKYQYGDSAGLWVATVPSF
ncbi:MAG: hypothetical protein ABW133_15895 [Polyangiaceae bacterium]